MSTDGSVNTDESPGREAPPRTRAEARATAAAAKPRSRFGRALIGTLAALALVGGIGAALSLSQGPRVSNVQVDVDAVSAAANQRLIITANEPLAAIGAAQVSIEPETPISVDASGRAVGVQFALPLRSDTEYTVTIADVQSVAGGPESTLVVSFTAAEQPIFVLQRGGAKGDGATDTIFTANVAGDVALPVFRHEHIEDYRATRDALLVSVVEEQAAGLLRVNRDGSSPQPFAVPGVGSIDALQASDSAGLVGYTYTDASIGQDGALESALFVSSVAEPDAAPVPIEVDGAPVPVASWRFVPGTASVLLVTFGGELLRVDTANPTAAPVALGFAMQVDGVWPGSTRAAVARVDEDVVIDLADAGETPLTAPVDAASLGRPGILVPFAGGGYLRTFTAHDEASGLTNNAVVRVDVDGKRAELFHLEAQLGTIMQVCGSPSGQFVAVLVAPDLVNNPFDSARLSLPKRLQTHILDAQSGEEVTAIAGFGINWCETAAWA